jgi:hypothetical protein
VILHMLQADAAVARAIPRSDEMNLWMVMVKVNRV